MIMLQKLYTWCFSYIYNWKQTYTNGIVAAYHKSKHILLARETFSRKIINYSEDMPADQKDRYIHYLVDKANELDLDKRAMELAAEEFQGIPQQRLGTTCRIAEKHSRDKNRSSWGTRQAQACRSKGTQARPAVEVCTEEQARRTVKFYLMSSWRYLGEFFKKIFNGCRDFQSLTPYNIGLSPI